ncbi:NAD(P)-dependent alcohol dehydrogenase [Cucumibacter marinus]|uniref:NAD(P)-dependent alcohol dehydrogenase n=1 Tax=Cucumibacter marinus TaxID=1121252 RepID=UPI000411F97F|nr:NAD(P)-dependent alcohol dehydrogenase [Cucumibacter marinus]
MRAILAERYGGPEVLRLAELPKPVPADNQVLIRIHATVATPPDCAYRKADPFIVRFFAGFIRPKNQVLGDSLSGVIEAVGKDVTRFKPGDEVFGATCEVLGAYAEYITLCENGALAKKPEGISHGEAAGLAEGFLTAMPFMRDHGRVEPGKTVLINGASGNVGSLAVQIAKRLGAEVTGVCSGRNTDMVLGLGADRVIDYTKQDFTLGAGRYDVIFDAVGKSSFGHCRPVLNRQGVYLTTVPTLSAVTRMLMGRILGGKGKRAIFAPTGLRKPHEKAKDLRLLADWAEAGAIRLIIDRRYPLADMAKAHAYVDTGRKRGSVVIEVVESLEQAQAAH